MEHTRPSAPANPATAPRRPPGWADGGMPDGPDGHLPAAAAVPGAHPPLSEAQMRTVLDLSKQLAVPRDLDDLLVRIAEAATVLLDCERSSIFLHDPSTNELWTKVALKSPEIR